MINPNNYWSYSSHSTPTEDVDCIQWCRRLLNSISDPYARWLFLPAKNLRMVVVLSYAVGHFSSFNSFQGTFNIKPMEKKSN